MTTRGRAKEIDMSVPFDIPLVRYDVAQRTSPQKERALELLTLRNKIAASSADPEIMEQLQVKKHDLLAGILQGKLDRNLPDDMRVIYNLDQTDPSVLLVNLELVGNPKVDFRFQLERIEGNATYAPAARAFALAKAKAETGLPSQTPRTEQSQD